MQLLPFASIYLLKAQIATEIYWFPLLVTGIFPAKSTCTRQNIFVVTGIGITVVEIQGSIQHIILWARTIHSLVFIWTDFFQNTVFACLQIGLFFTFCLFFPAPGFFKKSSYRKIPALEKSEKHVFSLSPESLCFLWDRAVPSITVSCPREVANLWLSQSLTLNSLPSVWGLYTALMFLFLFEFPSPNLRQFTLSFVFLVEFCPENFLLCFYWFCFLTIKTHFNFLSVISKILSYLQKPWNSVLPKLIHTSYNTGTKVIFNVNQKIIFLLAEYFFWKF